MRLFDLSRLKPSSYRKKLLWLFNLLFLTLLLFLLLIALFYNRLWSKQIYQNQQDQLTTLSTNFQQRFSEIELIGRSVLNNDRLLNGLAQTNGTLATSTKMTLRQDLQKEVDALRFNQREVKAIYLLNQKQENQVGFIYDSAKLANGLSVKEIIQAAEGEVAGKWFFSPQLTSGVFAQEVLDARQLKKEKVGYLIILVDLSFMQQQLATIPNFATEGAFFLSYQNQTYGVSQRKSGQFTEFLDSHQPAAQDSSAVKKIAGINYFFSQNLLDGWQFSYFLANQGIIRKLLLITAILLGMVLSVLALIFWGIQDNLTRLIQPIQQLAKTMGRFRNEQDLAKIQQQVQATKEPDRPDEIGVLYQSFDNLIKTMDQLVIKNYQEKLLNQEMELKALQSQLDPHFLYNTLDSINWMALSQGELEIAEMVSSLAFLFRRKIANREVSATIAEELDVVKAYVKIQSIRFKERLVFEQEVDPAVLSVKVPQLIIQPLIENSMKYALSQMEETCYIQLIIQPQEEQLVIQVIDNGPGFTQEKTGMSGTKLGLANIEKRLAILYGQQASLQITSQPFVATQVEISLPLKDNGDEVSEKNDRGR